MHLKHKMLAQSLLAAPTIEEQSARFFKLLNNYIHEEIEVEKDIYPYQRFLSSMRHIVEGCRVNHIAQGYGLVYA